VSFLATDVKRWPCCRLSHTYVAAALEVRSQLAGKSPGQVTIDVNRSAGAFASHSTSDASPMMADAKYSVRSWSRSPRRGAPSLEVLPTGARRSRDPRYRCADGCARDLSRQRGLPRARVTVETASRSASSEVGSLKQWLTTNPSQVRRIARLRPPATRRLPRERPLRWRLAAAIVAGFVQLALSRRDVGP